MKWDFNSPTKRKCTVKRIQTNVILNMCILAEILSQTYFIGSNQIETQSFTGWSSNYNNTS